MENKTTEFSFIIKPAEYGVGVFTVHGIKAETYLRLFVFDDKTQSNEIVSVRDKKNVPELFRQYCIDRNDKLICPKDFGYMEIGWHLNHSKTPNAYHRDYNYYALRDIKSGEEVTINYNSLGEPEEAKEGYYK